MGNRSYTVEVKTKDQLMGLLLLEEALPDVVNWQPFFDILSPIEHKNKLYLCISFNCTTESVTYEILPELRKFGVRRFKPLDYWATTRHENGGYAINGSKDLDIEEFWEKLT